MATVVCRECNGDGVIIPAGSCGGGCDFCPPGRRCGECGGAGQIEVDHDVGRERGCEEPAAQLGLSNNCSEATAWL